MTKSTINTNTRATVNVTNTNTRLIPSSKNLDFNKEKHILLLIDNGYYAFTKQMDNMKHLNNLTGLDNVTAAERLARCMSNLQTAHNRNSIIHYIICKKQQTVANTSRSAKFT